MGAATALPVRDVRVEPGSTTTAKMLVRNTGQVVDQYTIDVVGTCAPWTRVEPTVVNLLPGSDVEVNVTFAPEKSPQVAAGVVPFGLRVISREDPQGSAVAEGSVDVAPFDDTQVELVPRQSKGRRRGKHQVAIDNNGNIPTTVELSAADEDESLDFHFDHRVATIEPGAAAFIRMTAKPEKRFLKGADKQHPFVVTAAPNNAAPIATRGTMTQRQLLPAWLIPAVALVAALAIAAVVLYYTLLKPAIKSTAADEAKKAASSQNKSLASKASKAAAQADAANAQAKKAQGEASKAQQQAKAASSAGAGGAGRSTGATGPGGAQIGGGGSAVSFSVNTDTAPTKNNFTSFTTKQGIDIPANKVLVVTGMFLQNPNGDTGTLRIQRGTTTLMTEGLANFRDLDQHFDNEPLTFTRNSPLRVSVNCQTASTTNAHCVPSVLFTGRMAARPRT